MSENSSSALNSYLNGKHELHTPKDFQDFWHVMCAHDMRIYTRTLGIERESCPIRFANNCIEWLRGENFLYVESELINTEDEKYVFVIRGIAPHEFRGRKAKLNYNLAHLHVDKRSAVVQDKADGEKSAASAD